MNVVVYGTQTCSYCNAAKEFLTLIGVPFKDVDVADPNLAQDMINKTGQKGIPVIDVNGTIIVGFDRQALVESLRNIGYKI